MTLFLDALFFWVGLVAVVASVLVFLLAILVAVRDGHRRRRLEHRMDDFIDGVLGPRSSAPERDRDLALLAPSGAVYHVQHEGGVHRIRIARQGPHTFLGRN